MVLDVRLNKVFTETEDDNTVPCVFFSKSESLITDTESGEVICSKCGLVISNKIQETRPESRRFLNDPEAILWEAVKRPFQWNAEML